MPDPTTEPVAEGQVASKPLDVAAIAKEAWDKARKAAVYRTLPFDHLTDDIRDHLIEYARLILASKE